MSHPLHYTPDAWALAYLDVDTPLAELAEATRANAETIAAALTLGGVAPPAAQDLVTLAGRVTQLEARPLDSPPTIQTFPGLATNLYAGKPDAPLRVLTYLPGRVQWSGALSNAVTPFSAAANTYYTFATLPTALRPKSLRMYRCLVHTPGVSASADILIFPDGTCRYSVTSAISQGFHLDLSAVTYELSAP
jgi:hypothetical protein